MLDEITYTPYHSAVQQDSLLKRIMNRLMGRKHVPAVVKEEPALACDPEATLAQFQAILPDSVNIVLFRYGTCVCIEGPLSEENAIQVMRSHGPYKAGDESGDFYVAEIEAPIAGTIVRYNHPALLSFIPREAELAEMSRHVAGIIARGQRDLDGRFPQVVGVREALC